MAEMGGTDALPGPENKDRRITDAMFVIMGKLSSDYLGY